MGSPALLDALGPQGLYSSEFSVVGFGDDVSEPKPHTRTFQWGIREIAYPRAVNLSAQWLMAFWRCNKGTIRRPRER